MQSLTKAKDKANNGDNILFKGNDETKYEKLSPFTAKLEMGQILVSVRRPSMVGLLQTPIGELVLSCDSDSIVTWDGELLRVMNLSGRGAVCKINLTKEIFGEDKQEIIALAPGYELVAGPKKVRRIDMRPNDGIGRRAFQLLASGHIAISEFSVESVLNNSALIASLNQGQTGPKERRILGDMSKMAAVLNCINGAYGYTSDGKPEQGIAGKPNSGPN